MDCSCFRTSTRLQQHILDRVEVANRVPIRIALHEVELCVTLEELLARNRTASLGDFLKFCFGKVLWLSPLIFLVNEQVNIELLSSPYYRWIDHDCFFHLIIEQAFDPQYSKKCLCVWMCENELPGGNGDDQDEARMAQRENPANRLLPMQREVQILFDLLHVLSGISKCVLNSKNHYRLPVSAESLERFLSPREDTNILKKNLDSITLNNFEVSSEACAVLGRCKIREICLGDTVLADEEAFFEGIRQSKGPANLYIDEAVLVSPYNLSEIDDSNYRWLGPKVLSVLGTNATMRSLHIIGHRSNLEPELTGKVFMGLHSNRTLEHLYLAFYSISDEAWSILWQALAQHPSLLSVDLHFALSPESTNASCFTYHQRRAYRTKIMADALQSNEVLQHVDLTIDERDDKVWYHSIVPLLDQNVHRSRFQRLAKSNDSPLRRALLGEALSCVRNNVKLLYLCLQMNLNAILDD